MQVSCLQEYCAQRSQACKYFLKKWSMEDWGFWICKENFTLSRSHCRGYESGKPAFYATLNIGEEYVFYKE
jgi:hypothetical protein